MIVADTSTYIAYFCGSKGEDTELLDKFLDEGLITMVPPVLSELLSDPYLPSKIEKLLLKLPRVKLKIDYWERVGKLRRKILKKKKRAKLADALIAQACIDHNLSLITRDSDFKLFASESRLKLL